MVLICISLITIDVEHLFTCLFRRKEGKKKGERKKNRGRESREGGREEGRKDMYLMSLYK